MYLLKNARFFLMALLGLLLSCNSEPKKLKKQEPYTGPVSVVDDFNAIFSDSARILYSQKGFMLKH